MMALEQILESYSSRQISQYPIIRIISWFLGWRFSFPGKIAHIVFYHPLPRMCRKGLTKLFLLQESLSRAALTIENIVPVMSVIFNVLVVTLKKK